MFHPSRHPSRHPSHTEDGAATAEYATTCGVGVGFGGILYTVLTSEPGRAFIEGVVDKLAGLLPF